MAKVIAVAVCTLWHVAAYEHTLTNLPKSGYIHRTRWQPGWNFSWTLNKDSLDTELAVPVNATVGIGWISVGWSTTGTMGGSDLVFGYVPSGSADGAACIRSVAFVLAPDPGPNKPGSFNITKGSFSIENGIARLAFTRPLTSDQPHPKNVVNTTGPQMVMFGGGSAKAHVCKLDVFGPPGSMCGGVPKDCEAEMGPLGLTRIHDLFNDAAYIDHSTGELHPEGPHGMATMLNV
jgi:hypothetical protein